MYTSNRSRIQSVKVCLNKQVTQKLETPYKKNVKQNKIVNKTKN